MKSIKILHGDTANNTDMLYLGGIQIHDPFFCLLEDGKGTAFLNPLEYGRAKAGSRFGKVLDTKAESARLKLQAWDDFAVLLAYLKSRKIKKVSVAYNFPLYYAQALDAAKIKIEICAPHEKLFPEREIKSKYEVEEIKKANLAAEAGFFMVEEILRKSKIKGGNLFWNGDILTSEILIAQIKKIAIDFGADAMNTIAASGKQAAMPHCAGYGPIMPNSLIVVDIFPRLKESSYYGDMTRTFLKGVPSPKQIQMVETVKEAQCIALSMMKANIDGADIHAAVCDFFEKKGYPTKVGKNTYSGFFHSTGHGLGLDVHEAPRLGKSPSILKCGNVVTVEPGLYYPDFGGCRIEDTVLIEKKSASLLSHYHYEWIID